MTSSIPQTEPHVRAVLDRLRDQLPATVKANLGVGSASGAPYVSIFPDSGVAEAARLSVVRSDLTVRFFVHAVGIGPEQCMWVMDKARAALLDYAPAVDGRVVQRIKQSLGPQPMTRDLSTQPPVYLQVAEFTISSQWDGS